MDLQYFKDREEAIAAFDRLWDGNLPWVLAFSGISGQGKTSLMDYLAATRCQLQRMPFAFIGLAGYVENLPGLLDHLLDQQAIRSAIPARTFQGYRRAYTDCLNELNQRKLALQLRQEMLNATGSTQTMNVNLLETLEKMEREALLTLLPEWIKCLQEIKQAKIIIFADDYDFFQDRTSRENLNFLWMSLAQAVDHQPNLRIILASREGIRFTNDIPPLRRGLGEQPLSELNLQDSQALMKDLGVQDAGYCQAVYERLAHGHPLLTELAAQVWLKSESHFSFLQVPLVASQPAAARWLLERILERISARQRQAIEQAGILRWFNRDVLNAIIDEALSADDFRELTRLALFIRPANHKESWACHPVVRQVLLAYLSQEAPGAYLLAHQRSAAYFAGHQQELEALYHHLAADDSEAFDTWLERVNNAGFRFNHADWASLIEIAAAPEMHFSAQQQAEISFQAGRRFYYRMEMDAALASYQQALELFRAVGDRLGEANTLFGLAKMSLASSEPEQREVGAAHLQNALNIYREVGDRSGQCNILFFWAQWLAKNVSAKDALPFAQEAYTLGMSFAPGHPVTEYMGQFVHALQDFLARNGETPQPE